MTCTIHLTPRCRRPARGQVSLARLILDVDNTTFTLPAQYFRTDEAPAARSIRATDKRATHSASGILLALPAQPDTLVTTAIWRVDTPGGAKREVRHVVHWLLPPGKASMLSDDSGLWPARESTPALSPGDWPVMDITTPAHAGVHRRGLTVIDTRNAKGHIIHRYQSFPLADVENRASERIPDTLTPLT